MKPFNYTISKIEYVIYRKIKTRKWKYSEIYKKLPYGCKTEKQAHKRRVEFRQEILQINVELIELRNAIKILSKP